MRKKKTIRSTADIPIDPERPDTLLIFNSHRGSTLQYAKWLVEDLNCDVMPYTRQRLGYSILYRNVIFLSWVRAGEIVRLKLLRQFADTFLLPEKKVIIAAVGLCEPTPGCVERLRQYNMEPYFTYPSLYLLPGSHVPSKDRILKWMYGKGMYGGLPTQEAEILRERLTNGWDGVDRAKLKPILQEIEQAGQGSPAVNLS